MSQCWMSLSWYDLGLVNEFFQLFSYKSYYCSFENFLSNLDDCISITLSLTLQCKNLHSFLLFFQSDWQGIKLWCWNCHQGKCLHYWAKKIVWEWYILNLLRIFIFFLQYLFLILGVSSGRIFQACGVFSGEIRTTRLVSLRKKDRMFVTSVRTRVPWRQLVPLPAVPTKNQIQNPSSPNLNPAFPPPPPPPCILSWRRLIPLPFPLKTKSQILTHPPPKKPSEPHLRRL